MSCNCSRLQGTQAPTHQCALSVPLSLAFHLKDRNQSEILILIYLGLDLDTGSSLPFRWRNGGKATTEDLSRPEREKDRGFKGMQSLTLVLYSTLLYRTVLDSTLLSSEIGTRNKGEV